MRMAKHGRKSQGWLPGGGDSYKSLVGITKGERRETSRHSMPVIQPRQEDKEFSVCVHACVSLKLPTPEESLTNVTLERWGRWLCREGQVQAWRAMRQPLQGLMGLTQLGGGSLVERRS